MTEEKNEDPIKEVMHGYGVRLFDAGKKGTIAVIFKDGKEVHRLEPQDGKSIAMSGAQYWIGQQTLGRGSRDSTT
jgi:hypothetical protein